MVEPYEGWDDWCHVDPNELPEDEDLIGGYSEDEDDSVDEVRVEEQDRVVGLYGMFPEEDT